MTDDPRQRLLDFDLTDYQRSIVEAVLEHGSERKAGLALNKPPGTISKIMQRVRERAARQGYSPEHDWTRPVPDGHRVRGVSTYYNKDGKAAGQWVKSAVDHERQMVLLREAADAFTAELPRAPAVTAPENGDRNLLNLHVISDYHLGALAWGEETGADWDTSIAEVTLVRWFGAAILSAPPTDKCVFALLGDFLHWDGLEAVTPENKHVLDADTRFQKVVRVAVGVIRTIIQMLLERYPSVHVVVAEGNHDPAGSIWLREWLHAHYEGEPRLSVDRTADIYYCVEHGATSLFFHHGHKRGIKNLDTVFAGRYRDVFGRTKHSYAHVGHLHEDALVATNLMKIERHETLAAADAYSTRLGHVTGRSAKVITYHAEFGEVGRLTITPDMLR